MHIIGHRGARFEAPENTLPGFRYALELGVTATEFDIHLTADGQLAIIHDATVDRTTNGSGEIHTFTMDELRALDARSIFPDWPEPCRIPTLAEVLEVVRVLPEMEIEIKQDASERLDIAVPLVIEEITRFGLEDQVTITSFQTYPLEIAQRLAPHIRRGYIGNWDSMEFLTTAEQLGATRAAAYHPTADRAVLAEARARGMIVTGWPTNSREELASVLEMEPALICTDRPALIMQLLADQGIAFSTASLPTT